MRVWNGVIRGWEAFDHWVRTPVDPRPIAWFRAWFGLLCLVNIGLLWQDMPMWLGAAGVLPPDVHGVLCRDVFAGYFTIGVCQIVGYGDPGLALVRVLGVVGGLGLLLGVCPRAAAFCTWLAAMSYAWRNPEILHSGDHLVRIGAFFLVFARSDRAVSLSRWLRRRRGAGDEAVADPVPAWPQRILQLQLCVLYLAAGILKASGRTWRDGTAVGIVLQLGEFERFPIPDWFVRPAGSLVLTYGTILFELGFPLLVWVPRLRLPVLAAGLVFHAGLDWAMNVQLFQWLITSYYILFLDPRPDRERMT